LHVLGRRILLTSDALDRRIDHLLDGVHPRVAERRVGTWARTRQRFMLARIRLIPVCHFIPPVTVVYPLWNGAPRLTTAYTRSSGERMQSNDRGLPGYTVTVF